MPNYRVRSAAALVIAAVVGMGVAVRSGRAAGLPADTAAQGAAAPTAGTNAVSAEQALVNRYCVTCHNERRQNPPGAPLLLDQLKIDQVSEHPAVWEKVVRKVRSGAMPPVSMPRPDAATFRQWVASLEGALDRAAAAAPQVGRPAPVHRLNRAEYANAVRDLLGLEVEGRELLPADDSGYGFDNIGDVLSVSPGLLERYMLAATKISRQALGDPSLRPTTVTYRVSPYLIQTDRASEDLPFGSRGGLAVRHNFPLDAEYVFKINVKGPGDQQQVELRIDRAKIETFDLGQPMPPLEIRTRVGAGPRLVGAAFVSAFDRTLPIDGRPASVPVTSFEFSQSAIVEIQITGPHDGTTPQKTPTRERIFVCEPSAARDEAACARKIAAALARRAYRRPVTDADLKPLLQAYEAGRQTGDFEDGIQWMLEAVLVSPKFLFRVERQPTAESGRLVRISDLELASRLSFFLWSSIPDEELLAAAEQGRLSQSSMLAQQVERMLRDPRAAALVTNFGGQWLWLRNLRASAPNADLFPEFDDNLRQALQKETELFLADQLRADRGVVELLTADYTFLNERLARHYGIPNVYGSHFRRVPYPDARRAGLLGHGSVLTVTAHPNRTSPVVRGKWLLENLLGAPPPPPPPNVPALRENDEGGKPTTVRERMEAHRSNPVCASCHAQMDPLGFALENFDAIGRWRTLDAEAKTPIDASGTLVNGQQFNGPAEFRRLLLERQHDFLATVTEKLLTYALGRGVEYYDLPVVRQILRDAASDQYRWSALVKGIVTSAPFQYRQAGEAGAATQ